ncbi:MAG: hypothetical protein ACR2P5_04130 [Gammaproteobacteria bacterium]
MENLPALADSIGNHSSPPSSFPPHPVNSAPPSFLRRQESLRGLRDINIAKLPPPY